MFILRSRALRLTLQNMIELGGPSDALDSSRFKPFGGMP